MMNKNWIKIQVFAFQITSTNVVTGKLVFIFIFVISEKVLNILRGEVNLQKGQNRYFT